MATNQLESLTGKPLVAAAQRGTVSVGVAFDTARNESSMEGVFGPTVATNGGVPCHIYHYGSGFFFHDSGLILTCEHVRQDCRRDINAHAGVLVVCPYKGPTTTLDWSEAWKAEVVAHTAHFDGNTGVAEAPSVGTLLDHDDAAVLRIKSSLSTGLDIPAARPITVSGSPLKILRLSETVLDDPNDTLQSLASLGFPPGGGLVSATPILVQFSEKLDDTFLKLTGSQLMPGHSGGPLVTMSGVVVGWNVRKDTNIKLSHCKMIAVARKCIELTLPTGVTWSNLLASEDEEKAHAEQLRASIAAIGGQAAAVSEKSAKQAAGVAEQSAQDAHHHEQGAYAHALFAASVRDDAAGQAVVAAEHAAGALAHTLSGASFRDDAARQAASASASSERAAASETAAASSETAAAVSAAQAARAASTAVEVVDQAARQSAAENAQIQKLMQIVAIALPNVGIDDKETIRVSQPPHT